ncbi:hypothetical protein HWV62_23282 [Athelia sp. TMB]|nr:hypothetical protein HWV62_23282 [Athelia sp. TMB]
MTLEPNLLTALYAIAASGSLYLVLKHLLCQHPLANVPGPKSLSFVKGNIGQLFSPQGWDFHKYLADEFGGVVKFSGMWGDHQLFVSDPKALHHILVKDQYIYEETDWFIHSNKLLLGYGLLSSTGEDHRKQRKMLNPVFSMRHLSAMVPIFYDIAGKLRDTIAAKVSKGPQEIDMLHWMARTALELIGQSGLGYSFDDLGENTQPNAYADAAKKFGPTIFKLNIYRRMLPFLVKLGPPSLRRFFCQMIPSADVQKLREVVDIMWDTSVRIVDDKKAALEKGDEAVMEQVGRGKDIMSILRMTVIFPKRHRLTSITVKANMEAVESQRLPEVELLGQMSTLIAAATDTTSSALSRILHLLAQNPDIQIALRKEIRDARSQNGDLDYSSLDDLPYLDAIIRETLRFARKDMILPLYKPIVGNDGKVMTELHVPKGTTIEIAIMKANCDPDIWGSDASEWKPERWLKKLPSSVADAHFPGVYANLMTFSGGGRSCIGFKFSELEMKVVLSLLLESFSFAESKHNVQWNMGGISHPVAPSSATPTKSQMPLIVSAVSP